MRLKAFAEDLFDFETHSSVSAGEALPSDNREPIYAENRLAALYRTQALTLLRYFARRAGSEDARDLVHAGKSR